MRILLFPLLLIFTISFMAEGGLAATDHNAWNRLLQKYVDAKGHVDYVGISEDAGFGTYLESLSASHPDDNWSSNERLAFWINAYNAFTIKLITEHWPLNSIKDIDKPWDTKFIRIEQAMYSLNDIEHGIIRKEFDDPRIHFAVNCAARSCPPLWNKAFSAGGLDKQLEQRTKAFIAFDWRNLISPKRQEISKIFEWYATDFGDVRAYLAQYSGVPLLEGSELHYMDYDWTINARP